MLQPFHLLFSLFICMVMCCGAETRATNEGSASILNDVALLRDPGGELALEDVISDADWREVSSSDELRFGHDPAVYWLRTRLKSDQQRANQWVLTLDSSRWEELDWYVIRKNGAVEKYLAGNARDGTPGTLPVLMPNIVLSLDAGEEVTLYLRAHTRARGNLILRAENLETYAYPSNYTVLMICFGALALLIFLSLIFAFYGQQEGALAYALCITALSLHYAGLSGMAKLEGWPFSHFLSMEGGHFFSEIALLAGLFYVRSFFNLKETGGWPDRIWKYLLVLNLVLLPLSLLQPMGLAIGLSQPFALFIRILHAHTLLHSLMCFAIGVWASRRGVRFARFYLISWILVWLSTGLDTLYRESFFALQLDLSYIAPLGIVLSRILLFLSLTDKIRDLAREHEQGQKRLLEAEQQHNEELEKKVKERTASLELAREKAEKANRYKDLFLSNMSHEIRTPLSALIGLSQILVHKGEKEDLPENFRRMLGQIKSGGSHLDLMLTNLLDVGATSHGKIPLQVTSFQPMEWVIQIQDILEPLALAKPVDLHWEIDLVPDVTFEQDSVRLSQILINLVHNAIKFTPADEQVHARIALENDCLVIEVINHGQALPENPEILFEKFQKNHIVLSDNQHGVGLGLHIVKTCAELMGGTITAKNILPQGASFRAVIPNSYNQ